MVEKKIKLISVLHAPHPPGIILLRRALSTAYIVIQIMIQNIATLLESPTYFRSQSHPLHPPPEARLDVVQKSFEACQDTKREGEGCSQIMN